MKGRQTPRAQVRFRWLRLHPDGAATAVVKLRTNTGASYTHLSWRRDPRSLLQPPRARRAFNLL